MRLAARWRSRRPEVLFAVAVVVFGGLAGTALAGGWFVGNDNPWPYSNQGPAPVLAAVGDISCQPTGPVDGEKQPDVCDKTGDGYTTRWQAQTATATQIESIKPTLVAILGDEQYEVGRYEDFMGLFDHTYGAFKFLQRPTPGNHEFYSEHGETGVNGYGHFDYYNGYHVNADTGQPSPTMDFGSSASAEPTPLYAHRADLILNGHDHLYARFAPTDPPGNADPRDCIRKVIVGTGGESLDTLNPNAPNLQAGADQYYGAMKLTLEPDGYQWDYQSAMESPTAPAGTPSTYRDVGGASCHRGQE